MRKLNWKFPTQHLIVKESRMKSWFKWYPDWRRNNRKNKHGWQTYVFSDFSRKSDCEKSRLLELLKNWALEEKFTAGQNRPACIVYKRVHLFALGVNIVLNVLDYRLDNNHWPKLKIKKKMRNQNLNSYKYRQLHLWFEHLNSQQILFFHCLKLLRLSLDLNTQL